MPPIGRVLDLRVWVQRENCQLTVISLDVNHSTILVKELDSLAVVSRICIYRYHIVSSTVPFLFIPLSLLPLYHL